MISQYEGSGDARASFTDGWTIGFPGMEGTPGTLQFTTTLTGSLTGWSFPNLPSRLSAGAYLFLDGNQVYQVGENSQWTVSSPIVYSKTFIYGTPFEFEVALLVRAGGLYWMSSPSISDFYNTAILSDINVFDASGNEITNYSLTMPEGRNYAFMQSPPSVPEPSTLLLLGSGLIGLAGIKRKFKI